MLTLAAQARRLCSQTRRLRSDRPSSQRSSQPPLLGASPPHGTRKSKALTLVEALDTPPPSFTRAFDFETGLGQLLHAPNMALGILFPGKVEMVSKYYSDYCRADFAWRRSKGQDRVSVFVMLELKILGSVDPVVLGKRHQP